MAKVEEDRKRWIAEMNRLGPATVREKLEHASPGIGAVVPGIVQPQYEQPSRGDVETWLAEQDWEHALTQPRRVGVLKWTTGLWVLGLIAAYLIGRYSK